MDYDVVAIGRAYTDIIADVTLEFLQSHQIPLDGQRECSIAELKSIQELLPAKQFIAGGTSANTLAVVTAAGGKTGYFGKVFADTAGAQFLADLTQRQITLCCSGHASIPELSATCLVLIHAEQRSMAYNPGCADNFSKEDFDTFDFRTTQFFLIEAHLLTSNTAKAAILYAIDLATNKTNIVINLQGITAWQGLSDSVQAIAHGANIIIGNQLEQDAYTQILSRLRLFSRAQQMRITTQGESGASLTQWGTLLYQVPAEIPQRIINTNGAGDAFTAGFLFARAKGLDLESSLKKAVSTATAMLTEVGARPTRSLTELFDSHQSVALRLN
jgi:sugar/nucleoside kinase (ribokinase family)